MAGIHRVDCTSSRDGARPGAHGTSPSTRSFLKLGTPAESTSLLCVSGQKGLRWSHANLNLNQNEVQQSLFIVDYYRVTKVVFYNQSKEMFRLVRSVNQNSSKISRVLKTKCILLTSYQYTSCITLQVFMTLVVRTVPKYILVKLEDIQVYTRHKEHFAYLKYRRCKKVERIPLQHHRIDVDNSKLIKNITKPNVWDSLESLETYKNKNNSRVVTMAHCQTLSCISQFVPMNTFIM